MEQEIAQSAASAEPDRRDSAAKPPDQVTPTVAAGDVASQAPLEAPLEPVEEAGVLSVQVGRVFDVPEAWLVRDAIVRAPPRMKIALDFRRTAELHDFALAVLVETLAKEKHRIELRGLGKHHQNLLRMLGR